MNVTAKVEATQRVTKNAEGYESEWVKVTAKCEKLLRVTFIAEVKDGWKVGDSVKVTVEP
jgi:hypothetical protein